MQETTRINLVIREPRKVNGKAIRTFEADFGQVSQTQTYILLPRRDSGDGKVWYNQFVDSSLINAFKKKYGARYVGHRITSGSGTDYRGDNFHLVVGGELYLDETKAPNLFSRFFW